MERLSGSVFQIRKGGKNEIEVGVMNSNHMKVATSHNNSRRDRNYLAIYVDCSSPSLRQNPTPGLVGPR